MANGSSGIQLAHAPDFELGSARVRPALSEVVSAEANVRLQPRVMQVLVALAQANSEVVSRDELLARCWGGTAVGEDALNRCIQRLRKLGDELPDSFRITTIARVGYRLERVGASAASVEAPPSSEASVPGEGAEAPAPRRAGVFRSPVAVSAAGVLLAAGLLTAWVLSTQGVRRADAKVSIAVAPLQARAGDVPAQIVRAGLSNDLARAMVASPLQVRVTALGAHGPAAARRLILDGNAFTVGADLQAQLQLRDSASQDILWSKSFTGQASAADALRERAALKVGAVLNCALYTRQSTEVSDDAVRLYLSACDDIGDSNAKAGLDRLRRLIALAPRFAQAWAELAATVATTARGLPPAQAAAADAEAAADARHALSLDPHNGLAYFALVEASPGIDNWRRRMALIGKGLQVEPNAAQLDNLMGYALLQVGRSSEAIVHLQRAVDLDPLSPVKTSGLIAALTDAGRYEEAQDAIRKSERIWPRDPRIWSRAFMAEARLGDPEKAERLIADPDRPAMRDPAEVAYWRARLQYRRHPDEAHRATVLGLMQNRARASGGGEALAPVSELAALNLVDLAYGAGLPAARRLADGGEQVLFRSDLAAFRADPRFMTLAKRLGLVAVWRTSGRWPDFCVDAHAPYNCAAVAARAPD